MADPVAVAVSVADGVGVADPVGVIVGVPVGVTVGATVGETDGFGVWVGVTLGFGVGVAEGSYGVRRASQLGPAFQSAAEDLKYQPSMDPALGWALAAPVLECSHVADLSAPAGVACQ